VKKSTRVAAISARSAAHAVSIRVRIGASTHRSTASRWRLLCQRASHTAHKIEGGAIPADAPAHHHQSSLGRPQLDIVEGLDHRAQSRLDFLYVRLREHGHGRAAIRVPSGFVCIGNVRRLLEHRQDRLRRVVDDDEGADKAPQHDIQMTRP
jgi:hypothetical protein